MALFSRLGAAAAATLLSVAAATLAGELWRRVEETRGNLLIPADDPDLAYAYRPGGEENAWGFREREVPLAKSRRRVAVVGDSVTQGTGIAAEQAYPRVLEGLLGDVEVLNFGVVGYDVQQVAAVVRSRVRAFDPDVIVYGAYVNDHIATQSIAMGPGLGVFYVATPIAPEVRFSPWDDWLRPRSALFRWAQGRRAARVLTAVGPAGDWEFYQRWFLRLRAAAQEVPLVVLGIPPHVLADPDLARCSARLPAYGRDFCEGNLEIVQSIADIADVLDVPFVDGVAAFRSEGEMDYYAGPSRDPAHPSAAGHVVLARALVEPVRRALTGP